MGVSAWVLTASLFISAPLSAEEEPARSYHIVTFNDTFPAAGSAGTSPEILARTACLQFGCTVRHVYRTLPGMAIEGGRIGSMPRNPHIRDIHPDPGVRFDPGSPRLVGAPPGAPLAYIGPALDPEQIRVERTIHFLSTAETPIPLLAEATLLIAGYAARSDNAFWSLQVVDTEGSGKLSDVLAGIDFLMGYRYSVGAAYMPLVLQGNHSGFMCAFIDAALSQGLLLLSNMDDTCPLEPALPPHHR